MPDKQISGERNVNIRREGDVVLRDGSTVRIRAMQSSDEDGLCSLLNSLSEDSRWLRFYCLQNRGGWLRKLIEKQTWIRLLDWWPAGATKSM
jgi:hypothetical protein